MGGLGSGGPRASRNMPESVENNLPPGGEQFFTFFVRNQTMDALNTSRKTGELARLCVLRRG